MGFNLCVVGHKDTITFIEKIVKEYFNDVTIFEAEFGNDLNIDSVVEKINLLQSKCDGILYSRQDPYLLISSKLNHTIPVRYVDITSSDFLISILKADIEYDVHPLNISIDTIDIESVKKAFEQVSIPSKYFKIHTVNYDIQKSNFVQYALDQHIENYNNGATLCITNITDIHHTLEKMNIPVSVITPITESFVYEIRNLMLRSKLNSKSASNFSIIKIILKYKEKYNYYCDMALREIEEFANAQKIIQIFAEKLDSTAFKISSLEYIISCKSSLLEAITQDYLDIELMDQLYRNTPFETQVAIGSGSSVKQANTNANNAINKTASLNSSVTIICCDNSTFIGPIIPKSTQFPEDSIAETKILEISNATGLSLNTINKLFQCSIKNNSNSFTSFELANELNVTTRTVNRIIERLLDLNYARIDGRNLIQDKGRPARIIRLIF